jgi:16S rRNA (cytosine1402-N4)-methyltransferase
MTPHSHGSAGTTVHTPVLLQQIIANLAVRPNDTIVDGTAGGGGHAAALLTVLGPGGRYVAIDADAYALRRVGERLHHDPRLLPVHGNFRDIDRHLASLQVGAFDRLLLDLGFSSDQLEAGRGFSFTRTEPLVMTISEEAGEGATTAWHVVNDWSEESLADVLYGFGGERAARKIARAIVNAREMHPIETTTELANLVAETIGRKGKIHPATKTFQAIRMAVNDELGALTDVLTKALPLVRPGGRIAVITFHSLEDRIVKRMFMEWEKAGYGVRVNKHVITPDRAEVVANPRSRSAKLRVFEKQG